MPVGKLQGDRVVVPAEKDASTLYNKGAFGTPQSGGGLELSLLEAVYLVEQNRLDVQGTSRDDLLTAAARAEARFEVRYAVYRDLRQRTFVVREGRPEEFAMLPPGGIPGRDRARALVRAVSERGAFVAQDVLTRATDSDAAGTRFLLAIVDEEGEVTYYKTRTSPPEGKTAAHLAGVRARAVVLRDRAFVTDANAIDALVRAGHFGRLAGPGLLLSLVELVHLARAGAVDAVDAESTQPLDAGALASRAREIERDFDLRHRTYEDLRARNLVVKTGFKFGAHFRGYPGSPEEGHAPWLVHAVTPDRAIAWPEVAGFIRVAHGVRKRMLFAVDGTEYLELAWTKP